jgi:mannose-6-phosphate isomerase class I
MSTHSKFHSNYDKFPKVNIQGYDDSIWYGKSFVIQQLLAHIKGIAKQKHIIVVECYPGVTRSAIEQFFPGLKPSLTINTTDAKLSEEKIASKIQPYLLSGRIFGKMNPLKLKEFFDLDKISAFQKKIRQVKTGVIIIYGLGASIIAKGDIEILADMPRWEIQKRYRRGMPNWLLNNPDEDFLRKYKLGYFIEWRIADCHKKQLLKTIDYLLDISRARHPKLITQQALFAGLKQTTSQPFRVVPFFDPGPWGGQWMKQKFNLDKRFKNFAWCFDCVPEENSLMLAYGKRYVEIPAMNVLLAYPKRLLGKNIYEEFGAEFPIRFDMLDTVDGGNLSLQVHPLLRYIKKTFGMAYTQDESYYILDAKKDASVFLGLKKNVDSKEMLTDLEEAQTTGKLFNAEKYVNRFPAKKHDHFLIPAGTIHCSGKDTMVLEISATPYIFTFKLWDWGRLGLDGKPRPISINHAKHVIQWNRDTQWVKKQLINQTQVILKRKGVCEERTGLHDLEFIETRRHWFSTPVEHYTHGTVNVLNLVEGNAVLVTSPDNKFKPFKVHYAETFIIPAVIDRYCISPLGKENKEIFATIKAYVKF